MFTSGLQQWITSYGTLTLNGATRPRLLIVSVTGFDNASLRAAVDNKPQQAGAIVHRALPGARYPGMRLLLDGDTEDDVASFEDQVKGAHQSILDADGRIIFQPPGLEQRFIAVRGYDEVEIDPVQTGSFGEPLGFLKTALVPMVAGDPYAYTYTQTVTNITDGGSANITNAGNAPNYPTLRVYGAYTAFTLTNETTGESIEMGNTIPMDVTDGHYIEIITSLETCVYDGDVSHVEGYLDVTATDFWALQPDPIAAGGVNTISASFVGADASTKLTVLSNSAWS